MDSIEHFQFAARKIFADDDDDDAAAVRVVATVRETAICRSRILEYMNIGFQMI
jgi:hypothetical protein